ncbi:MAG: aminotransferase class V-fold PLP-dependent enzyme [Planctomycetaceae bacterium]
MYLDHAATAFPRPDCVLDAVLTWLRRGGSAGRGGHSASLHASSLLLQTRAALAEFLQAPGPQSVLFTAGCTASLNTVLLGLLQPGDHVIASELDHNSVLRPLQHLQGTRGISVQHLPFNPDSGLLNPDELRHTLQRTPTRLVVLTHASNVTGRIQDIRTLTCIAHEHQALVLLDAAQTVGHWPCSLPELNVDFLAAAAHKGLAGPPGIGFLVAAPHHQQLLHPLLFGGTGTDSTSLDQPAESPARFESGTANLPAIAGLLAAVRLAQNTLHERHTANLRNSRLLASGLAEIPGLRLLLPGAPEQNCGIVSFVLEGLDPAEVAGILDQSFDIQCRAGLHCAPLAHQRLGTLQTGGAIRFSPGWCTTEAEITAAVDAVRQIAQALPE